MSDPLFLMGSGSLYISAQFQNFPSLWMLEQSQFSFVFNHIPDSKFSFSPLPLTTVYARLRVPAVAFIPPPSFMHLPFGNRVGKRQRKN